MSMNFPEISMTQFAVSFDEVETGIILNKDFERYTGQGEYFYVFDSIEEAESFSVKVIKERPNLESVILSYDKSVVKIMKDEDYINQIIQASKAVKKKKWWHFK